MYQAEPPSALRRRHHHRRPLVSPSSTAWRGTLRPAVIIWPNTRRIHQRPAHFIVTHTSTVSVVCIALLPPQSPNPPSQVVFCSCTAVGHGIRRGASYAPPLGERSEIVVVLSCILGSLIDRSPGTEPWRHSRLCRLGGRCSQCIETLEQIIVHAADDATVGDGAEEGSDACDGRGSSGRPCARRPLGQG